MNAESGSRQLRPGEQYEADALAWEQVGRPEPVDPKPWYTAVLYLWVNSRGAQQEGVTARLHDYLGALRAVLLAQQKLWYEYVLSERDYCSRCGERYRVENLGVCTSCAALYCPRHPPRSRAANGNAQCDRRAVGEIVG